MRNETDVELFDDLVENQLGHYVYALFDPATGKPFYIGKGGGRSGLGNCRIFDHFDEARSGKSNDDAKLLKIREIWESRGNVPWKIIRSGLESEKQALQVEGALIDMLLEMEVNLTNKQSGHHAAERGIKSPEDLRIWRAPELTPSILPATLMQKPIFVFNIGKGVSDRRAKYPDDCAKLYREATCQFWNVTSMYRNLKDGIAIGCINGISRSAVMIESWRQESETRWEIIPNDTLNEAQDVSTLTYKNVSTIIEHCKGFWQRGNFLVFRIEDESSITILRGSPNRTISFSPK